MILLLINRPVIVTPLELSLCRSSEVVWDVQPEGQKDPFAKERNEKIIGDTGSELCSLPSHNLRAQVYPMLVSIPRSKQTTRFLIRSPRMIRLLQTGHNRR